MSDFFTLKTHFHSLFHSPNSRFWSNGINQLIYRHFFISNFPPSQVGCRRLLFWCFGCKLVNTTPPFPLQFIYSVPLFYSIIWNSTPAPFNFGWWNSKTCIDTASLTTQHIFYLLLTTLWSGRRDLQPRVLWKKLGSAWNDDFTSWRWWCYLGGGWGYFWDHQPAPHNGWWSGPLKSVLSHFSPPIVMNLFIVKFVKLLFERERFLSLRTEIRLTPPKI